jgi:hypothetical protein
MVIMARATCSRRFVLALLLTLCALPLLHDSTKAQLSVPINLARMVDEAENIVLARVTQVEREKHPQLANVNTVVVTLEIIESLKGSSGKHITLRQYVIDARDSDSKLGYRVGEEIVLCLRRPSEYGLTSPVGFEQGRFRVEHDAMTNRSVRNGMDNAGLFSDIDETIPTLKANLPQSVIEVINKHRTGSIPYEEFKLFVQSELAVRRNPR